MDLNKFDEPFSHEDIEWRIQQSGKTRDGKVWAMVLAYVTNRAIMKRLDDVCGKAGWRNEYRDRTRPGSSIFTIRNGICKPYSCYVRTMA